MTKEDIIELVNAAKQEVITAIDRQAQTIACLLMVELKLKYKLSTQQVLDRYVETDTEVGLIIQSRAGKKKR